MREPRVSVVTAAYNRANVLRFTIESLLASTFEDWEMLVIGDACTDDTEDVVRRCGDSRVTFFNLPVKSGDQAAPNNEGVRRARGEFVAFLNQDDLWTRDHLASCLAAIGEDGFVSALTVGIRPDGEALVRGAYPRSGYHPLLFVPASSWLMRRTFFDLVGPWRPARELHLIPSQEWLYRAWKRGLPLRSTGRPTVLAIGSGHRRNSYSERLADEHVRYAALLRDDPEVLSRLALAAGVRQLAEANDLDPLHDLASAARKAIRKLALATGLHPLALSMAWRYRRRGGYIDSLRRNRGLPPLPRGGTS